MRQLDTHYILQILREADTMKEGDFYEFRMRHHFDWEVRLVRKTSPYKTFNFYVKAICLELSCVGTYRVIERSYKTIDKALLHCLNAWNENATIRDRYKRVEDAFALKKF